MKLKELFRATVMAMGLCPAMTELVDAHGSGPCAERCGGSSPLPGTNINEFRESLIKVPGLFFCKEAAASPWTSSGFFVVPKSLNRFDVKTAGPPNRDPEH